MTSNAEILANIISGYLTLDEALEAARLDERERHPIVEVDGNPVVEEDVNPLNKFVGKNVFIRTITYHYIGKVVRVDKGNISLKYAVWVAVSERFSECIAKGAIRECEAYPEDMLVLINDNARVDICEWKHPIPTTK